MEKAESSVSSSSDTAATAAVADLRDVGHQTPVDLHEIPVWIWEPQVRKGVLTVDGMTQIVQHKYQAGTYTYLDSLLSPYLWQPLTDHCMPLWVAPNVITCMGGLCCLITFILSSWYLQQDTISDYNTLPRWLFFSNGICMFLYYTLDCMDGKQARRTNSSSPLGQLFDHGMDCICNLAHLKLVQCIFLVHSRPIQVLIQSSLQLAFYQAQWEEYYTGILPHATGDYCGVTEVNYGMAVWSIMTGILGRQVYDVTLYTTSSSVCPAWLVWLMTGGSIITSHVDDSSTTTTTTATANKEIVFQVKHVALIGWITMVACLIVLSWQRVYQQLLHEEQDKQEKHKKHSKTKSSSSLGYQFGMAMSKLISPWILCIVAMYTSTGTSSTSSSISLGLCFCLITIKMIVYSMARMAYASIQLDIFPYVLVTLWTTTTSTTTTSISSLLKPSWIPLGLDIYYLIRLLYWVHEAITQLCDRLQVPLFRLPTSKPSTTVVQDKAKKET